MRRRSLRSFFLPVLVLILAGFGGWQLASGAWIHAKARLAQSLLDSAWQQTQEGGGESIARPWPWADTWPVARLVFPRLGASFIVLAGDSGSSLAFGPGHTSASAAPGRLGTAVITGHRDTHFRLLAQLRAGDRIEVERPDGVTVAYRIATLEIADARRDRVGGGGPGPVALALVTCWPFDAIRPGGPLRYVVSAYALPGGAENRPRPKRRGRAFATSTHPPQHPAHETGFLLRSSSSARVPLRLSGVGPPTLRLPNAESQGTGSVCLATASKPGEIGRQGPEKGSGPRMDAQRNSACCRVTIPRWAGRKETTAWVSDEAQRPVGIRAPGPLASS